MSDKPSFLRELPPVVYADGWPLARACRALLSVDELFSAVRARLAAQGRTNVLYLLTADNGMGWGDHRWVGKVMPFTTPMPLSIRWEGHDGGARVARGYVQNVDLAPTLAAIAGTRMGSYADGRDDPDGQDISALLADPSAVLGRTELLEEHAEVEGAPPGWFALRTTDRHDLGLWHYIEWNDGSVELYDLKADPNELDNHAGRRKGLATQSALAVELASMKHD